MTSQDPYTNETDKRFTLRMDKELFERISFRAKKNRRSVAKEIEVAVEMYVNYCDEEIANGANSDSRYNRE